MIDFTGKKFGLISLGCDKNRVDSEKALAIISSRGGVITNDAEDAQILIINTCAFLNEARKEAIEPCWNTRHTKAKTLKNLWLRAVCPKSLWAKLFPL